MSAALNTECKSEPKLLVCKAFQLHAKAEQAMWKSETGKQTNSITAEYHTSDTSIRMKMIFCTTLLTGDLQHEYLYESRCFELHIQMSISPTLSVYINALCNSRDIKWLLRF